MTSSALQASMKTARSMFRISLSRLPKSST